MTKQGVIEKVRAILNEVGEAASFTLLSEDLLKLDMYVESVMPDAVNIISRIASLNCLNASEGSLDLILENGFGRTMLPSDFLRLSALRLKGWKRAVNFIHPLGSEEYKVQHNEYTRSGINKPVCLFSGTGEIECFPAGELEYFRYVKVATTESFLEDILRVELHQGLCYMCASLVYEIFENTSSAERMRSMAETLLK